MVLFLLYEASSASNHQRRQSHVKKIVHILEASLAILSKISFTKELRIAMALFEIPVSGCTCLSTVEKACGLRCDDARQES